MRPGDANFEVESDVTLQEPAKLVDLMPHMHLRGKDFVYTAFYPTGEIRRPVERAEVRFQLAAFLLSGRREGAPRAGTGLHCAGATGVGRR